MERSLRVAHWADRISARQSRAIRRPHRDARRRARRAGASCRPARSVGGSRRRRWPRSRSLRSPRRRHPAEPSRIGWIGVMRIGEREAGLRRQRTESPRERKDALAPPGLRDRYRKRRARRGGDRDRQRRRIDVGARALDQRLDKIRIAGDEGAEAAESLAERADERRHIACREAEMLERCRRRLRRARRAHARRRRQGTRRGARRRLRSRAAARGRRPC